MRTLLLRIVFAAYLVALGFLVWSPQPLGGESSILAVPARWIASWGVPYRLAYDVLEVGGNIALFVPFGMFALTAYRWMRVWSATLAGLVTSGIIEGVQLFLPTRFSTVSDLVANTSGALLGALIVAGGRRIRDRRDERDAALSAAASRPS